MQQQPNDQPDWQQPQYQQPSYPQQPSQPNWPPLQSGQLPPQYTQYPQQPPYQQTGPGMPPPPQYTQYPYQQSMTPGMYPPQQPPPPLPSFWKRKVGCLPMWLLIAVLGLCVVSAAIGSTTSKSTNTTLTEAQIAATNSASFDATNSAQSTASVPVATATIDTSIPTSTPAPTVAPAKWTTTHSYQGSDIKKTSIFTVPDDWKITWSCNPSSFYGSQYNVQVYVYNSDGSMADVAINALCKPGNTSGETEEHQSGDVYLDINSEADWTIKVQEFK